MRKVNIIVLATMILSMAVWSAGPTLSSAEQFGAQEGMRVSAHVSGPIIGKVIRSESGATLGTVANVVLSEGGCAQYIILSGEFAGARSRYFPIPLTIVSRTGPDAIFVRIEPAVLVNAPSFERKRLPDFSQWGGKVETFFRTQAEGTVSGKPSRAGEAPGVLPGEQGKPKKGIGAQRGEWKKPATQGVEKSKGKLEIPSVPENVDKGAGAQRGQWKQPATEGAEKPNVRQDLPVVPQKEEKAKPMPGSGEMKQGLPQSESRQPGMMEQGKSGKKDLVPGQGKMAPGQKGEDIK